MKYPYKEIKLEQGTPKGEMLESEAREMYCEETGFEVNPACLQHKKYSWARASLDGISNDRKRIVEIKCGQKAYEMALSEEIPNYYYGQLQHIMFVTGLDSINYWCYSPGEDGILLEMERDDSYINEAICIAEKYKGYLE